MEKIVYTNEIDAAGFNKIRAAVGWPEIAPGLAQKGLDNSAYKIAATLNGEVIGMARVVTDYGYTVLIMDVAVLPEYQGMGIGKTMFTKIMEYIDAGTAPGEAKYINLMAAKGKEGFYEKFGFEKRPNEQRGCGMTMWIQK